ncbi:hypothetical protein MHU86_18231 [Fragilaria crotonensis]|nr:hypothetical protein MHU86_18231 [Fragilaria crotonensis]
MLAFYFHLHPGNYSGTLHTTANDDRFRYQDVGVWIGHRHLDPARCTATLHVQAQPVMAGVAAIMLRGGDFRLNIPPFPAPASLRMPGAPPFLDPHLAPMGGGSAPTTHSSGWGTPLKGRRAL